MDNRRLTCIWWALLLIQILPFWGVDHLLTQDGPLHLYSASVFIQLLEGASPAISEVFEISLHLSPNWVGPFTLIILVHLFGVVVAEKLMISLIIVTMATGYRYVLKKLSLSGGFAPFLIFPFLLNHYLFMGLYPFLLGTGLSLWVIGEYIRCRSDLSGWKLVWLSGLLTVNYFCHLIPAALTGISLLSIVLFERMIQKTNHRDFLKDLMRLACAGAPSAVLTLMFLAGRAGDEPIVWMMNSKKFLNDIVLMNWLIPYSKNPLFWTTLWSILMLFFGGWGVYVKIFHRRWVKADVLLLIALIVLILKVAIPEGPRGGSLIAYRMSLFFWLALAFWFSVQGLKLLAFRYRILLIVSTLLIAWIQPLYVWRKLQGVSQVYGECQRAFESIAPHSQVWIFVFNPCGERGSLPVLSPRNPLLTHFFQASAAAKTDVAVRTHYQGEFSFFPVRYRGAMKNRYFSAGYDECPETFPLGKFVHDGGPMNFDTHFILVGTSRDSLPENAALVAGLSALKTESHRWSTSIGTIEVLSCKKR